MGIIKTLSEGLFQPYGKEQLALSFDRGFRSPALLLLANYTLFLHYINFFNGMRREK